MANKSIHPPPVLIPQPAKERDLKSNLIYKWYRHQQGIESLEYRITCLEAELIASKATLEKRIALVKAIEKEITGVKKK